MMTDVARIICSLFGCLILISSTSVWADTTAPEQKPVKFAIIEPWKEVAIRLVIPGISDISSKTQNATAYRAVYEFAPKREQGIAEFSMLIVNDPNTNSYVFIDGEHSFYLSEKDGLTGVTVGPKTLIWSKSYLTVPASKNRNEAISEFERTFDATAIDRSWNDRGRINGISYGNSVPLFYSSDGPFAGGLSVIFQIKSVEMTNKILHLEIRNPITNSVASLWFNLDQKKVVKSIVDGKEMNLDPASTNRGYAIPLNGK